MKKIGLLAVHNHNYGSILQTYALQRFLEDKEYSTEILLYKKTNYVKQAMRLFNIPLLKATVKMKYKSVYAKAFQKETFEKVLCSRERAFADFINENVKFSKVYKGRQNLINGTKNYDAFVLGSDQVWNPMNLGGDYFTMTFIPDNKKKITYAPSFGVSVIPEYQRKKTAQYLKRIDCISVRELSGQKIVKQLTGRTAQVVVDPTMLVDKSRWDELRGDRIVKEPYIMCYFISTNPNHRIFAKRLAKKTGLKIVTIPHVDEFVKADVNFGDIVPSGVGPAQFINLISNAEYVCTDSFHATVFSVLYERKFFTFNRFAQQTSASTNSRLTSILKILGLESRMTDSKRKITNEDLKEIDFTDSIKKLNSMRKKSEEYLINSLEE